MLENAQIITKLLLDHWWKFLWQDILTPYSWWCFGAELCESPLPWMKTNTTYDWSQDASLLTRYGSPFLCWTIAFPDVPNSQRGG